MAFYYASYMNNRKTSFILINTSIKEPNLEILS